MTFYLAACRLVLVCTACLLAGGVRAEDDPLARELGLTKASGSLPVWTAPTAAARRELGNFVRQAQQGVMLVGYQGNHGTAWVVSKRHRLLATNAHVADVIHEAGGKVFAILNGTATVYKVERAWYHPGVRRRVDGSSSGLHADKPEAGGVDPNSPDVALLQLSADGPDLPVELKMAGPAAFEALFAESAAILGYPGTDTRAWPALGEIAQATFHDGVISRLTNFQNSVSCGIEEKQFLQYTMSTWGGFSGSPILLPSGEVVALHNSASYAKKRLSPSEIHIQSIPHGVRIDCLWELLVHHHLTDKVPIPVDKSSVNVARWLKEDPRDAALRKAMALVKEAKALGFAQDYAGEARKCSEAIELAPNYAPAYSLRGSASADYVATYHSQISSEQRWKQLTNAEKDITRAVQLNPSDPKILLDLAGNYIVSAVVLQEIPLEKRLDMCREALAIAEKITKLNTSDFIRGLAHSVRAAANDGLGRYEDALRDHNEAIRLGPDVPGFYWSRSEYWRGRGRADLQQKDLEMERKLRGM